ncbi:Nucleoside ABC transporter, permease protein 2 [Euzebya pacifica]|uniref:Nucleoside ABC transporter, permease protein 2 n=1 Tax=Euzebya pacifica TaxID=1608957 RepID=A0A346Y0G5_9ACTN|nr:ABC transporter permease [Euzebya pacifica]AXV07962.1 Nucleoside ABC transporter, permease protein 2 [Euzebya pacifica]
MEATLAAIVAAAAPLVFASVGETLTERAGVVNLSLDGSILLAALTGFAAASTSGSVLVGFAAAAAVGAVVAGIVAVSSIRLGLNQIAVGFVLTLLCAELSSFLGGPFVRVPGESVPAWPIPVLSDIPFLGEVLFDHNASVYASMLVALIAWFWLYRTRFGLELQAIGEHPAAAWVRGIAVNRLRVAYTLVGGALVGVAGAAFSLDVKLGWSEGSTTNFGWIALAIVIFGGWDPVRAALGCYLFGALQVLALQLQPVFPGVSQILPIIPFPLMILTLVVVNHSTFRTLTDRRPGLRWILRNDPPAALGTAFQPE